MTTWRSERTGWRDHLISERHGHWGFNCPAVDVDFLMIEYHYGSPCALVEYKHSLSKQPNLNHPSYRAMVKLADGYSAGPLPCFVATYNREEWTFDVTPLNRAAARHYQHVAGKLLTEQQFVRSLHLLRKRTLLAEDEAAIARLNGGPKLTQFA